MARARSIKPGFFKNEDLANLGPDAMLLYAGLWTLADRAGRLEDRPRRIKAEVFPYFDRINIDKLLCALADAKFIVRYEVSGFKYIAIPTWKKHQNPHCKEAASTIPAPCEHGVDTVHASPFPERAVLTPDSLNRTPCTLTPDSPAAPEPPKAPALPATTSPRYASDDAFCAWKLEYEATGAPFIEGDWLQAYDAWRILDFEQKLAVVQGFRAQIAAGRWRDPTRVKKPANYIREGEYTRPVVHPPPRAADVRAQKIVANLEALDAARRPRNV